MQLFSVQGKSVFIVQLPLYFHLLQSYAGLLTNYQKTKQKTNKQTNQKQKQNKTRKKM